MDSGDNYRRWNVSQLDAIPSQLQVTNPQKVRKRKSCHMRNIQQSGDARRSEAANEKAIVTRSPKQAFDKLLNNGLSDPKCN